MSIRNRKVNRRTSRDPLIFDGAVFTKVEKGSAEIEMEIDVGPSMLNPNGVLHGGMTYTLGDTCAGVGAYYLGYKATTIEGNMNYLRAHSQGKLRAKSILINETDNIIVSKVRIINDSDQLIASGTFTMAKIGKAEE